MVSQTMEECRWNPGLRHWLGQASRTAGFHIVGVAEVRPPDDPVAAVDSTRFSAWIDAGYAGEMEYLKRRNQQGTLLRSNLRIAMPWARSAIVCALNYTSAETPRSIDPAPLGSAWIARYALTGRTRVAGSTVPTDYHDVLLARLRNIEEGLLERVDCITRCYVDTGPLVERTMATEAGIGWIGKNTCLINQQLGSWLLLGVIVTSLTLEHATHELADVHTTSIPDKHNLSHDNNNVTIHYKEDNPAQSTLIQTQDRCGSCTRCIDACPTNALLGSKSPDASRTMDASRCIAYLTIEKKGAIDPSLRVPMGRHVFGCDICQDVCPWNHKASITNIELPAVSPSTRPAQVKWDSMQPRTELINPTLDWLAGMDASQFKRLFKGSPLERTGRKRLLRNVAIAMGNSGEARFLPQLEAWSASDDPVLADAALWARARLLAL